MELAAIAADAYHNSFGMNYYCFCNHLTAEKFLKTHINLLFEGLDSLSFCLLNSNQIWNDILPIYIQPVILVTPVASQSCSVTLNVYQALL